MPAIPTGSPPVALTPVPAHEFGPRSHPGSSQANRDPLVYASTNAQASSHGHGVTGLASTSPTPFPTPNNDDVAAHGTSVTLTRCRRARPCGGRRARRLHRRARPCGGSPKPGVLTAATLAPPGNFFTTSVANASSRMSSPTLGNGLSRRAHARSQCWVTSPATPRSSEADAGLGARRVQRTSR